MIAPFKVCQFKQLMYAHCIQLVKATKPFTLMRLSLTEIKNRSSQSC